ncbi:hypothetical protein Pst134EB_021952 [Puccinia striiformis f. sp. tritici]|nr:hypothetical protein Pst134EB_021952 [Puccinia striiformis f. sp. tritici]
MVRLHGEKLATRIKQIEEFLVIDAKFKYNEAEILAGRLNHVLYMVPQLRCYLTSLYHWMNEWADRFATRSPSPDALGDLNLWRNTLQQFDPMRLIANPDPTNVGDALAGYRIGVLIGRRWAQFQLRSSTRLLTGDESEPISRLETIAVRLGLLMLIKLSADKAKRVASADNRADTLSRGDRSRHLDQDRLAIQLPEDLCDLVSEEQ